MWSESPGMSGELQAHLHEAYGLAVRRLIRLPGADPVARAYRAETEASRWLVKLRPGWAAAEVGARIGDHLGALDRPELLAPVRSLAGAAVTELALMNGGEATVVVWPFRAGRTGFEVRHSAETLTRVGSVLRDVHDLAVPAELAAVVEVNDPTDRWRRAVSGWYATEAPAGDELVDQLVRLLDRRRSLVLSLVSATAELTARLPTAPELVLCHGDLHAGNVLVGPRGEVTIIDWDSAVLGDRERDLMFPGAAIGGTWTDDRDLDAFSDGYGPLPGRDPDPYVIAFYRGDRVLADVALFTEQILDSDDEDRPRALQFLTATLGPGDAAEAAERTIAALP